MVGCQPDPQTGGLRLIVCVNDHVPIASCQHPRRRDMHLGTAGHMPRCRRRHVTWSEGLVAKQREELALHATRDRSARQAERCHVHSFLADRTRASQERSHEDEKRQPPAVSVLTTLPLDPV
jgi:hypothetical protein